MLFLIFTWLTCFESLPFASLEEEMESSDCDITTAMCSIVINGTKGEVSLYSSRMLDRLLLLNGTLEENTTTHVGGIIVRDSTVIDDGGVRCGCGDNAPGAYDIETAAVTRRVGRDGAIVQRERASVKDTTAGYSPCWQRRCYCST